MGIINASPESFYKGSVRTGEGEIADAARQIEKDGASIIDVGAMSTAPYLETMIPLEEEVARMKNAIKAVRSGCKKNILISADTPRAQVAREAIAAGAHMINDVTGLKYDGEMAKVVSEAGVPVIVGAYGGRAKVTGRIEGTIKALKESIAIAKKAGIGKDGKIIVDPSIGFFRDKGRNPFFTRVTDLPWYIRDLEVISRLCDIASAKSLGEKPVCISISRKSFIGNLLNLEAQDRLVPSLIGEMVAVQNGASIIRTHSVRETVYAMTMLELLLSSSSSSGGKKAEGQKRL